MTDESTKAPGLLERAKGELIEYLAISTYLAVFLGALLNYRRIVLADVGVPYARYGYAIVEALILGKVILIGDALRLDQGRENRPLVVTAAHRSIVFGLLVLAFQVIEHGLHALVEGESVEGAAARVLAQPSLIAAHALLVFLAFIPFFMLREAGRQLGEERFLDLMLRRRRDPDAEVTRGRRKGAHG